MNDRLYPVARPLCQGLLALALLTAVGTTGLAQSNVLRVIPHADLKNTDPIWTTAYITRNHGYMVYDTLFALNDKLEPQPQMVDRYTVSPDGRTFTFTLRDGLRWHDGAAVTSADAVASIQRWGKRDGMGQKLMDATGTLEVVNDRTFRLQLKQPFGLVLDSLGKISSNVPFIMPERFAKTDAFTQVSEPIGSGPFRFVKGEWVPGSKVVYTRNEGYRPRGEPASMAAGGKVARVERVEWVYIPDPATAQAALRAGEVDYYEVPPVDLAPTLARDPNITVAVLDPLGTLGQLRLNHLHPPFDNPKARQAMLWLVKQEDYLRSIIGDPQYWRECPSVLTCGTPLESNVGTEPLVKQDLERARALFQEAGYKGERVVLMDPTDVPILHGASLVTAQLLRKIGVNVDVQAVDWSTLTSRRAEKKPPAEGGWNIFHTWTIGVDASNPIWIVLSGGCAERAWFGWPCDAELERLRDVWASESDKARQKQIAEQIQLRVLEVVTHVNYGQWFQPTAYRKNLQGVIKSPVPFFWNISKS